MKYLIDGSTYSIHEEDKFQVYKDTQIGHCHFKVGQQVTIHTLGMYLIMFEFLPAKLPISLSPRNFFNIFAKVGEEVKEQRSEQKEEQTNNREGMIYNPIDGEWRWL